MTDTGNKDIAWLQVEMNDLMAVQIAYNANLLAQKAIGIVAVPEIIRMIQGKLAKRCTIDIVHQDAVVSLGNIANQMRVIELVAYLKLFL